MAEQLLAERGSAAAVPVAEIVGRVGVTAPVLYQHFADKDALFVAVHARRMRDFRDTLRRSGSRTASPLAALERRGRAYIRYATTKPDAYMALFMTPTSLGKDVFEDPEALELTAFDDLLANVAGLHGRRRDPHGRRTGSRRVWCGSRCTASRRCSSPCRRSPPASGSARSSTV